MGLRADKARCAAAELTKAAVEDDAFGNLAESAIFRKYLLNELDKSFASAVYKGTLSWITNIDALIASVSFRDIDVTDPFVSAVLRNAVWQIMYSDRIPDHSAVDESVSVARSLSGIGPASFVNAVLRKITSKKTELKSRYITDPVKYHLKCGLPPELAGYFKKWFGAERGFEIAASLHQNAEITIRVNRMISGIDEIMLELTEAGIEFEESEFIRDALIIQTGGRDISSLKGFRTGSFTVQDEAAMLASVIADPSEGDIVVDLCAAPGGKACHMGELMNNKGKIYAFDINPSRIRLIDENTQRLGINVIKCFNADARVADPFEGNGSKADLVLADVPCSGLGILRRKPDIMLRMDHEKITGLYPLQRQILDHAAELVRVGGYLVYSTCTVNPEENENLIRSFIADQSGSFETVDFSGILSIKLKKNSTVVSDIDSMDNARKGMITLYPDRHGCDGFFISKMRRMR